MAIRKTGGKTGKITEVDIPADSGIVALGAREQPWGDADERELAAEDDDQADG